MSRIELNNVRKEFGTETIALDDINLTVNDGEFVVLLGPSGCGKSTLLRCLTGLEHLTAGTIYVDEVDVTRTRARDRDLAMVFQNYALYPHKNVFDNIAFGLKMRRVDKSTITERVEEAARMLDLTNLLKRRPAALSGGQRQRVAMGRAIVRRPKAFLMDEPLSNLDALLRVDTRAELAELQRSLGITTIYVTHDQVEALTMGGRIAVMREGVLQQYATPHQIYHDPANRFVASFIGSPPMNLVDRPGPMWQLGGRRLPSEIATVGARPEAIKLIQEPHTDISMHGVIVHTEDLGSEVLVYVSAVDDARWAVRTEPGTRIDPGTNTTIWLSSADLYYFDAAGSRRPTPQ